MRLLPVLFAGAAGLSLLTASVPARADWEDYNQRHSRHAERGDWRWRGDRDDWRRRGDRDDWRWRGDRDDWHRHHRQGWNVPWTGYYGYGFRAGAPGFNVIIR